MRLARHLSMPLIFIHFQQDVLIYLDIILISLCKSMRHETWGTHMNYQIIKNDEMLFQVSKTWMAAAIGSSRWHFHGRLRGAVNRWELCDADYQGGALANVRLSEVVWRGARNVLLEKNRRYDPQGFKFDRMKEEVADAMKEDWKRALPAWLSNQVLCQIWTSSILGRNFSDFPRATEALESLRSICVNIPDGSTWIDGWYWYGSALTDSIFLMATSVSEVVCWWPGYDRWCEETSNHNNSQLWWVWVTELYHFQGVEHRTPIRMGWFLCSVFMCVLLTSCVSWGSDLA